MDPWNILGWLLLVPVGLMVVMIMTAILVGFIKFCGEILRSIRIRRRVKKIKSRVPVFKADDGEKFRVDSIKRMFKEKMRRESNTF